MRFIHISDVHLGSSPEAAFEWGKGRAEELWDSFAAVMDVCNERQVDLLLIAGDLFDHPPVWAELDRVNNILGMLSYTEVVMIAGANDYICQDSAWLSYPWKQRVHLLSGSRPETVYIDDIATSITGCSYHAAECADRYLEEAGPDSEGEYQILLGYSGDASHMPVDVSVLADAGFDYVALGCRHESRVMAEQGAAWSGSLEPLSFDETGEHGFILGETDEEGVSLQFEPFACREYVNISIRMSSDISQEEIENKLSKAMAKYGSDNFFCLKLEGRFLPGKPYDRNRLMKLGNVVRVIDKTVPDYNFVAILNEHKDDMIGMYLEEFLKEPMDELQQRALYCGLEALLDAVTAGTPGVS